MPIGWALAQEEGATPAPAPAPAKTYTLLQPLPCIPYEERDADGKIISKDDCSAVGGAGGIQKEIPFDKYIQYLFNLIIALAAVAAVLVLVWGGFKYVTTDSFAGKNEGRKIFWQALQGLLLILCSYIILRTIDPRLVAIPQNLVNPLKLDVEMGLTNRMFRSLSEKVSKKDLEVRTAQAAAQKASADLNELDKKIKEYEDIIASKPGTPEAAQAQRALDELKASPEYKKAAYEKEQKMGEFQIKSQVRTTLEKVAAMTQTTTNLVAPVSPINFVELPIPINWNNAHYNSREIDAEFDSAIEHIERVKVQKIQRMQQFDAPPEAIKQLDDTAKYEQSLLLIEKTKNRLARTNRSGDYVVWGVTEGTMSPDEARAELLRDLDKALTLSSQITTNPQQKKEIADGVKEMVKLMQEVVGATSY